MTMKRKLTMFIVATALLCSCLVGCKRAAETQAPAESEISLVQVVPNDESSAPVEESSKPEEVKLTAAEFLAQLLGGKADLNEVSARQQLWQAGYTPAEIREAVEAAFPKTDAPKVEAKEESSKPEDSSKPEESSKAAKEESSMQEESSKAAEESSQESTEAAENRSEESSSGSASSASSRGSEASTGSSGSGSASSGSSSSASSSSSSTQESQTQQQAESTTQESQSSSSGSSASSGSQESQQQTQESAPAHVHTWVDVTETVHHDAVTEQVWVVDEPAWDETVDKTEEKQVQKYQCRCGEIFDSGDAWDAHWASFDWETAADYHDGWTSVYVYETVVVGTETIHHDEVGHYETKTVTEAYDEEVVVGQKCSECGATK